MPELPEMQALAERIEDALSGAALERVTVIHFSSLKTVAPTPDDLRGEALTGTFRRGKYVGLDFGAARLLVHLSQGGRIDFEDTPKTTRPRGALVRFVFDRAPALLVKEYGTERKAAWWVLAPDDDGPLDGLGPEPSDPDFAAWVRAADDRRHLHTILRDQRTVAGIGRGFADDILHAARLSPFAPLGSLSTDERDRLLDAVQEVLDAALARERTRTGGLPAKLGGRFTVHGRFGEACPRCGNELKRVSFESREVVYCPECQTGGKILADRRLSRLLR